MQPQQTDVLDVDGPAVAPSIIEGNSAPTSPAVLSDELFGDDPVITGPVGIVEPTFEDTQPADVFTFAEDATATAPAVTAEPVQQAPAEKGTEAAGQEAVEPAADTAPEPDEPSAPVTDTAADASTDAADEQTDEPEDTDVAAAADDAERLDVEELVQRVEPPKPDLVFTLEELEAATPGAEKPAAAEVVLSDESAASNPDANDPWVEAQATPEAAAAAVAPQSAPDVEPVTQKPAVELAGDDAAAAPTKTATYEDIMNSKQEFVGAIKTKKFPLIDPDQFWVMVAAVVALGTILAANLTASFTSVYAMAAYTGLPKSVQAVPVVALDFAIVGFSWALMVFGARGDKVWSTRLYLFVVTGFSVVANFMHTYTHWKGDLSSPEAIFGVVFSSAVPLFSLVATEELIRLVFIRRNRRKTKKAVA